MTDNLYEEKPVTLLKVAIRLMREDGLTWKEITNTISWCKARVREVEDAE